MTDVFISYARKDQAFVHKLHAALAKINRDTWVDWEDIPLTAEWLKEIFAGIESANTFVFVISPDSVASKTCNEEIAHAAKNNKRIVPIMYRDVPDPQVPPLLRPINWIFFRESDDFDTKFKELIQALDTDLDWLRAHTRLLVRAIEWNNKRREGSLLLRGKDLREAEEWQAQAATGKEPKPTALQSEYVLASRKSANTRQRITLSAVTIALAVAILLSMIAFAQTNLADRARETAVAESNVRATAQSQAIAEANARATAQANAVAEANVRATTEANAISEAKARATAQAIAIEQARISNSKNLASQSKAKREGNFALALLLGIEAVRLDSNSETQSNLFDSIRTNPQLLTYLWSPDAVLNGIFSPDGKILASVNRNSITLWSVATKQPLGQALKGAGDNFGGIAFSPDGKILASGICTKRDMYFDCEQGEIILWDVITHQPIGQSLKGNGNYYSHIALAPDGKTLASGSCRKWSNNGRCEQSEIMLWDIVTRQPIGQSLEGHGNSISSVAFSPDGHILASGDGDGTIILWDMVARSPITQFLNKHAGVVLGIAFSPDGRLLASGGGNSIIIWDVASLKPIGQPILDARGHVAWSPDGKMIVGDRDDNTIIIWEVATRKIIGQPLKGHSDTIFSVAYSPDGKMIVSGSRDGSIILWNVTPLDPIGLTLKGYDHPIQTVTFNPDSKSLAAGYLDGTNIIWDIERRSINSKFPDKPGYGEAIKIVAFSPNGKILASGTNGGIVVLWDVLTRQVTGKPLQHSNLSKASNVVGITFNSDGKLLASAAGETAIVWDTTTRQPIGVPFSRNGSVFTSVALNPNGKILAAVTIFEYSIILWDVATHNVIYEIPAIFGPIKFSPNGRFLAARSLSGSIILFDGETFLPIGTPLITRFFNGANDFAFSPDSNLLATGGCGQKDNRSSCIQGKIVLWDVTTHLPIGQPISGHNDEIVSVAFSPDGQLLASGSYDNTIMLWKTSTQSWLSRACQIVNRNLTLTEWVQYVNSIPSTYRASCPGLPLESITTPTPEP